MAYYYNESQVILINDKHTSFTDVAINKKLPFIIRSSEEFKKTIPDVNALLTFFLNETEEIYAHGGSYGSEYNEHYISSVDLYDSFKNGTLQYNIVDSANENYELIPTEMTQHIYTDKPQNMECAVAYVLTNKITLTKFHLDQYDGWMYLVDGKKLWWMICGDDVDYLESNGYHLDIVMHMNFDELINILDGYLANKMFVGLCQKEDFIYFPFGYAHRVYTFEPSIGVSGTTDETRSHKLYVSHNYLNKI